MMVPLKDEARCLYSRANAPLGIWLFLTAEFWLGGVLSGLLTVLTILRSLLPKPPRDLTGEVVLVAGAASSLGSLLAEEFANGGCTVICLDNDLGPTEKVAERLRASCPQRSIAEVKPGHRKEDSTERESATAYSCDFLDRNDIIETARKIQRDVRRIDILVTCVGSSNQDIFDTASRTLMSHYWTVLAFLPWMMRRRKGHVVGVTPVTSDQDAFLGSKVAIASLMESLGRELGDESGRLVFLAISPIAEPTRIEEREREVARDVVQAIRRNQSSLRASWLSKIFYRISCAIYNLLTAISRWIQAQGCDYDW